MSDSGSQFVKQAQEANRSMGEAMRGLTGTQFKIMQQLVGFNASSFSKRWKRPVINCSLSVRKESSPEVASTQADLAADSTKSSGKAS